jgi:hypothetical protein
LHCFIVGKPANSTLADPSWQETQRSFSGACFL